MSEDARLFERSFERPRTYFKLTGRRQWEIDEDLGLLDWSGGCGHSEISDHLCESCAVRFAQHYKEET